MKTKISSKYSVYWWQQLRFWKVFVPFHLELEQEWTSGNCHSNSHTRCWWDDSLGCFASLGPEPLVLTDGTKILRDFVPPLPSGHDPKKKHTWTMLQNQWADGWGKKQTKQFYEYEQDKIPLHQSKRIITKFKAGWFGLFFLSLLEKKIWKLHFAFIKNSNACQIWWFQTFMWTLKLSFHITAYLEGHKGGPDSH